MTRLIDAAAGGGVLHWALALEGTLLLTRRGLSIELTIDQKVIENAAGAPVEAIGPALDAGGMLLVNEDVARADEGVTLTVVWTTRNVVEATIETSFEQDEGLPGIKDDALVCWRQGTR